MRIGSDAVSEAQIETLFFQKGAQIVRGVPGSGKTTFAKYLSLLMCGTVAPDENHFKGAVSSEVLERHAQQERQFAESPSELLKSLVPLYIPVRRFVNFLKKCEDGSIECRVDPFIGFLSWDAAKRSLLPAESPEFFETILSTRRGFLIFDGLDEASELQTRQRLVDSTFTFIRRYPGNRYLLTSRPAGLEQLQLPQPDQRRMWRVQPFNHPEKMQFTEQWYRHFLDEPTERENYTRSLKQAITGNPGVGQLSETPILITMMALLHMGSSQLPEDRGQLYSQCVDLLLHDWEMHHKQEASDLSQEEEIQSPLKVLGISSHEAKNYLARVAFEGMRIRQLLHEKPRRQLELLDVDVALDMEELRKLSSSSSQAVINEKDFQDMLMRLKYKPDRDYTSEEEIRKQIRLSVRYIKDRAGLLYDDTGNGDYVFAHLSLQESLAAIYLARNDEIPNPEGEGTISRLQFIRSVFSSSTWREVLLAFAV